VVYLFKQIRLVHRHPLIRSRGTSRRYGTLVTIQTAIMADLKKKRAVSEGGASLDALATTDAESFVDGVLVVGLLDKLSFYRSGGAKLVFGAGFQHGGPQLEIARTEIAISAYSVNLNALDRGFFQYALRRTVAARHTRVRIDLPYHVRFPVLAGRGAGHHSESRYTSSPEAVSEEMASVDCLVIFRHYLLPLKPFWPATPEADRTVRESCSRRRFHR